MNNFELLGKQRLDRIESDHKPDDYEKLKEDPIEDFSNYKITKEDVNKELSWLNLYSLNTLYIESFIEMIKNFANILKVPQIKVLKKIIKTLSLRKFQPKTINEVLEYVNANFDISNNNELTFCSEILEF
jgi:hypothetical protein